MGALRFRAIDLSYGCHRSRFELPRQPKPVVILGPNGAGKTTLMEALVYTLYGFDSRREMERLRLRTPWHSGPFQASVEIADDSGDAFSVQRNFRSQEVVVTRLSDGAEIFRGDADPSATHADATRYRRWLAERIGLDEREQYENTACVKQGELTQTRLGDHLLIVAAGGHRDVAAALAEIETEYYELTREPLDETHRRRGRECELELVELEVADIERRLAEARAALDRADPILRSLETTRTTHQVVTEELRQLEEALPALAERRAVKAERDAVAERVAWLDAYERELADALSRLDAAEQAALMLGPSTRYPDDFRERAAVLQELWLQRSRLDRERAARQEAVEQVRLSPWRTALVLSLAVVLLGAAGAAAMTGRFALAVVLAALGVLTFLVFGSWRRSTAGRYEAAVAELQDAAGRVREVEEKIAERLEGVPDAVTLKPDTLPDRRIRFEAEQKARASEQEARRRVEDVLARAVAELTGEANRPGARSSVDIPPDIPRAIDEWHASATKETAALREPAERLLATLRQEAGATRTVLAAKDLDARQILSAPLPLPADVPAAAEIVETALRDRRARRDELEGQERALEQQLVEYGRPAENPVVLEERLERLRTRWDEIAARVEVRRRAYQLVTDAYREFRTRDQERLLASISSHLSALTHGTLGPLDVAETLESVQIRSGDRALSLQSPPLSYGEFHAALLAIRLGAADFLARAGVRPAFLVDEPFTHLDEHRSAAVWSMLASIARDRQVIVTTQDRLVLDALKVQPDLILTRGPVLA